MCVTVVDPANSWFEMVNCRYHSSRSLMFPPWVNRAKIRARKHTRDSDDKTKEAYFNKSSATVGSLVKPMLVL